MVQLTSSTISIAINYNSLKWFNREVFLLQNRKDAKTGIHHAS